MAIKELDTVKVNQDISEMRLKRNMIGTVVHIHEKPNLAYLVEFCDKLGRTNALYTLLPDQISATTVTRDELAQYRERKDLPYNPTDGFCADPYS